MREMNIDDIGGNAIAMKELVSDELIGYIENLNPNLGVKGKDPYYDMFEEFRSNISDSAIYKLDRQNISKGQLDDIDLTGAIDTKEFDLKENGFLQIDNKLFMSLMLMENLVTPFTMDCVHNKKTGTYSNAQQYTPFDFPS